MIVVDKMSREFLIPRNMKTKVRNHPSMVKKVIKDLTFHIPKGEIIGIIGSNGAGKSTLIKMMVGVLAPTTGTVRIQGMDPVSKQRELSSKISVVFGTTSNLMEDTVVEESFLITRKSYGISMQAYQERYEALSDVLAIEEFGRKKKEELSLGEERRANLAMSLLVGPELLILDEALIGLDSIHKQKIMEYLRMVNQKEQMTIVITSHNLVDIRTICSRVLLLQNGTRQYYGSIQSLEQNYACYAKITISFLHQIPDLEDLAIMNYTVTNEGMVINYNRNIISAKTILNHVLQQCDVKDVQIQEQGLEEALLNLQKENLVGYEQVNNLGR